MTDRILRFARFSPAVSAILALTGCGVFGGRAAPIEQCEALMTDAYRDGDIEITGRSVANRSIATQIVTIQGARRGVAPTAAVAHEVAVECKFDHDVLIDFHWTKAPFR